VDVLAKKRDSALVSLVQTFSLAGAVRLICLLVLQGFFVPEVQAQQARTHAQLCDGYVPSASRAGLVIDTGTASTTADRFGRPLHPLSVDEAGGTNTFRVALCDGSRQGTYRIESTDPTIARVSGSLTFNAGNWRSVRTVTVTGVNDDDINRPNRTAAVFFSNNTGGDRVLVTALDDDQEITVSRTGLDVGEAGGIATYTLVLKDPPVRDVMVTPVSDDPRVATVSGTLTFTPTNWDTPQIVTVAGVNNDIDDALNPRLTSIRHRVVSDDIVYGGLGVDDVLIRVNDDDTAGLTVSRRALNVVEAGTGTYQVVLDSQPIGPVRVTPRSQDGTVATVSPQELTFTATNWNVRQTVTVTGGVDAIDNLFDRTVTVNHEVAGSGYGDVTVDPVRVTLVDDDGPLGVRVSTAETTIPAMTPIAQRR